MSMRGDIGLGYYIELNHKQYVQDTDYLGTCWLNGKEFNSQEELFQYVARKVGGFYDYFYMSENGLYGCFMSIKLKTDSYGDVKYKEIANSAPKLEKMKSKLIELGFKVKEPVVYVF